MKDIEIEDIVMSKCLDLGQVQTSNFKCAEGRSAPEGRSARRPLAAMSEEKRPPFAGYRFVFWFKRRISHVPNF